MPKKMLIDATHPEETRVVVADGSKVEEFDFESINKRQLSGNIYLAKVTRVEPSLQAAFVEYGGNRHGFLAFSEIHPDYYQIPVADREALLAAEEAEAAEEQREADRAPSRPAKSAPVSAKVEAAEPAPAGESAATAPDETASEKAPAKRARSRSRKKPAKSDAAAAEDAASGGAGAETASAGTQDASPAGADAPGEDVAVGDATVGDAPAATSDAAPRPGPDSIAEGAGADDAERVSEPFEPVEGVAEVAPAVAEEAGAAPKKRSTRGRRTRKAKGDAPNEADAPAQEAAAGLDDAAENGAEEEARVESVGAEEAREEIRPRKPRMRNYKIQEVIKVRQIMLVQVVKEERGNKGAALTTYLSLAGRYCVLMPNTARGGGVSRKITSAEDRKKLKEIAAEFEAPKGMGLIIRTAGAKRTRLEIKRDYEFLLRQWEEIRELTLKSVAPALIYEEGSLIKRSIRDLYSKDIEEILVEGDEAYREAKEYMRMLMPSHAKNVKPYKDDIPLFSRHGVESYLAAMFNPTVQLKSGGYIVIGVTEALVAIDVNSGRSTREGSIEETALKTNLEAADEVARQLRLRDLAGLIVIDFIDMDERRNNAAVEKRMKDRLSSDRARIQIGRISPFGLMEMSRQRLRPGMIEASTAPCPHCHGTGLTRSDDSLALSILREVEEEGVKKRAAELRVKAPVSIANYIMNQKRAHLMAIEARCGLSVMVEGDPALISPEHKIERLRAAPARPETPPPAAVRAGAGLAAFDDPRTDHDDEEEDAEAEAPARSSEPQQAQSRAGGARPGEARGGEGRPPEDPRGDGKSKRRRGKRGGRRRRREDEERLAGGPSGPGGMEVYGEDAADDEAQHAARPEPTLAVAVAAPAAATVVEATDSGAAEADLVQNGPATESAAAVEPAEPADAEPVAEAKPKRRRTRKQPAAAPAEAAEPAPAGPPPVEAVAEQGPEAAVPPADVVAEAASPAAEPVAPEPVAASPEPAPASPEPSVAPEPDQPKAAGPDPDDGRPRRRGWWSFGAR